MKYFSASFYYVNYRVLGNIIRQTYQHFRLRIWLVSIVFVFLYSLNQFIHLIFRLIDEIFYSGFHKKDIKQPVFIISNPRSGTTYLHRLIALDSERFAFTTTYCAESLPVPWTRSTKGFGAAGTTFMPSALTRPKKTKWYLHK